VLVWLIFELLYSHFDLELATIFRGYSIVTVLISAPLYGLWIHLGDDILSATVESDDQSQQQQQQGKENKDSALVIGDSDKQESGLISSKSPLQGKAYGSLTQDDSDGDDTTTTTTTTTDEPYQLLRNKSVMEQMMSLEFLVVFLFQCVHSTRGGKDEDVAAYIST
jgi:hypothetical protein